MAKTTQEITYSDGVYRDKVSVAKNGSDEGYDMELSTEEVEVEME